MPFLRSPIITWFPWWSGFSCVPFHSVHSSSQCADVHAGAWCMPRTARSRSAVRWSGFCRIQSRNWLGESWCTRRIHHSLGYERLLAWLFDSIRLIFYLNSDIVLVHGRVWCLCGEQRTQSLRRRSLVIVWWTTGECLLVKGKFPTSMPFVFVGDSIVSRTNQLLCHLILFVFPYNPIRSRATSLLTSWRKASKMLGKNYGKTHLRQRRICNWNFCIFVDNMQRPFRVCSLFITIRTPKRLKWSTEKNRLSVSFVHYEVSTSYALSRNTENITLP